MSKKKSLTSEERVAAVQEYLDGKGGYKAINYFERPQISLA